MELMMGLVVLMVVMMIAMPLTSSLLRELNLRSAAEDLVYAAELARSRARSNRRAYGLFVGTGGLVDDKLIGTVLQGTSTACSSVPAGKQVHDFDYSKNNKFGRPEVLIAKKAPGDFQNANVFICFKPDGRVLNGLSAMPLSPPSGSTFAAGEAFFELVRVSDQGAKIGNRLQVQITYSGNARITHGYNLNDLK